MGSLCSFEDAKLALPLYFFMPYIQLAVPCVVIVFQETNFCFILGACNLRQFLEFLMNRFDFCQSAVVSSGIIQDTMPVNLGTVSTGSPAEIADIVCTMCYALHSPQGHLSRLRSRSCHTGVPSVGSGLLFHDTKVFGYRTNLRQIAAPHPVFQKLIRLIGVHTVCKVRIGIIGQKIQTFLCHSVIIQVCEHTIRCHKIVRFDIFADNIALHFCKSACTVRYKSGIIQHLMGIRTVTQCSSRHINLFEAVIRLVPEIRSPGIIQCIDGFIFILQKFTKSNSVTLRIKDIFFTV